MKTTAKWVTTIVQKVHFRHTVSMSSKKSNVMYSYWFCKTRISRSERKRCVMFIITDITDRRGPEGAFALPKQRSILCYFFIRLFILK